MKKDNFKFERYVLPNNLKIIAYHIPHVESVYLRLDVKTGTVFENEKNNGISHFLEHWIHQGNEKYDHKKFVTALEKEGIYQNASTSDFGICYWMKATSKSLKKAINLLFLLTAKPIFPQEREKHVQDTVINEYHDYWQNPENKFYKEMLVKRFIDSPSYVRDSLGNPQNIINFKREEVWQWYIKYHHAGNFLLTIAGNFEKGKLKRYIEKTFGTLPKTSSCLLPEMTRNHYSSFLIHPFTEKREQITFSISIPTFGWKEYSHKKRQILRIMLMILGTGRFSRLNQTLREENNLVYNVSCNAASFPKRGFLTIDGMTSKNNLKKTIELIKNELFVMKKKGIKQEELNVYKNILRSMSVFNLETPEAIANHLVSYEFWDLEIISPENFIQLIDKISKKDVNEMAKNIFDFSKINIGLFGNIDKKEADLIKKIFI